MSSAADSAVATVPLERSIEILERKLIELRADIDAILTQLASSKTAIPSTEPSGHARGTTLEAIAEHEPAPAANGHSGDEAEQLAGAEQLDAIEPDRTSAVEASPETALVKELPIASIEADPAGRPNGLEWCSTRRQLPSAETAAPQAELQAEPTGQAAVTALAPSSDPWSRPLPSFPRAPPTASPRPPPPVRMWPPKRR